MKRQILAVAFAVILAAVIAPGSALAAGYVASKNSDVFHESNCYYVGKIKESNKIYFGTIDDAQNSGRRGCYRCNPTASSSSPSKTGSSSSSYANDASSLSDSAGYYRGYSEGKAYGYNKGYSDGLAEGKEDGYSNGYAAGQADTEEEMNSQMKSKQKTAYCISFFIVTPIVVVVSLSIVSKARNKTEKELESQISSLKQALQAEKNNAVLRTVSPGAEAFSSIPDGISLKLSCIPIKGSPTSFRPYGDYTVYTTSGGKKYHCKYRCCNATKPVHFFQLPTSLEPCKNCVPRDMYPQKPPEWYMQIMREVSSSSTLLDQPTTVQTIRHIEEELAKYKSDNALLLDTISRQERTINKYDYVIYVLNFVSENANMPVENIAEALYVSFFKRSGIGEEEAKKRLDEKKRTYISNGLS